MKLQQAKAHWWILKEEVDTSGSHVSTGHVAALFNNELYEFAVGRTGVARLQSFGVIFGYSRVVIYVEPFQNQSGGLTANTARTQLLIDGHPLPWSEWAAEFRENMPEAIKCLMDQVAAGTANSESAQSIRERLKRIRELFRFSRYRPAADGKHTIDDSLANAGGSPDEDGSGKEARAGGGGSGKSRGGRAGDIYSLFAAFGDTPAEEIGGFTDPQVTWVSVTDGSRTIDFLEDRAAKYLPEVNKIQANADFRVFTDMIARWRRQYAHAPAAGAVVEVVAREWFAQQLIETVLGALALRKSGNWSEVEVSALWSEEALTSAVLPRYHVDESIKRSLGSKLGTLRDKEKEIADAGKKPPPTSS